MSDTITIEPTGKRARKGAIILVDRMCEKRVATRVKIYDCKCPGLFVSITAKGAASGSSRPAPRSTP
jgi:hypothetical protein